MRQQDCFCYKVHFPAATDLLTISYTHTHTHTNQDILSRKREQGGGFQWNTGGQLLTVRYVRSSFSEEVHTEATWPLGRVRIWSSMVLRLSGMRYKGVSSSYQRGPRSAGWRVESNNCSISLHLRPRILVISLYSLKAGKGKGAKKLGGSFVLFAFVNI